MDGDERRLKNVILCMLWRGHNNKKAISFSCILFVFLRVQPGWQRAEHDNAPPSSRGSHPRMASHRASFHSQGPGRLHSPSPVPPYEESQRPVRGGYFPGRGAPRDNQPSYAHRPRSELQQREDRQGRGRAVPEARGTRSTAVGATDWFDPSRAFSGSRPSSSGRGRGSTHYSTAWLGGRPEGARTSSRLPHTTIHTQQSSQPSPSASTTSTPSEWVGPVPAVPSKLTERHTEHPATGHPDARKTTSDTLAKRAYALYQENKHRQAEALYTQYLEIVPKDTTALYNRAGCYCKLKWWKQALADVDECMRLKPNYDKVCGKGKIFFVEEIRSWQEHYAELFS